MTTAFVQKSTTAGKFAGTDAAAPGAFSGGAAAGNLLVFPWSHLQFDQFSTSMTVAGYSAAKVVNQASNISSTGLLYKVATGGETTATMNVVNGGTSANSFGQNYLAEFSGLDAATPYVVTDSNTATGVSQNLTVSSGNPLSQAAGVAVATFVGNNSLAGATIPPAGWTTIYADATTGETPTVHAYLIYSSAAQLTAALGTATASSQWAATINIFKAASGSITPPLMGQILT